MTNQQPEDFSLDAALRAIWDEQPTSLTTMNHKELAMTVETTYQEEERILRRLLLQEVTPAVVMFAIFGLMGLNADSRAWAFFLAAVLSLGVGLFMLVNALRQRTAEKVFGDDMRGGIERALSQAEHRAWLYRRIAWWYLAPATVAIALVWWGTGAANTSFTLIYGASVVVFIGWLYRINRKVGRQRYEPRVVELESLLADLDSAAA